ncbi:MAG: DUF4282 domain-containing protein [Bacteroidetes bacterium]|nr:DUF4282 domain-containing protein [Bacteroidota bacterium]
MKISDFLSFNTMISPTLIRIFFLLGVALIVLSGLIGLLTNFGLGSIAGMLIGVPLAIVLFRVFCETIIIVFSINENLIEIRDKA